MTANNYSWFFSEVYVDSSLLQRGRGWSALRRPKDQNWHFTMRWKPESLPVQKLPDEAAPLSIPRLVAGDDVPRRLGLAIAIFNIGGMAEKQYDFKGFGGGVTACTGKAALLAHQFATAKFVQGMVA